MRSLRPHLGHLPEICQPADSDHLLLSLPDCTDPHLAVDEYDARTVLRSDTGYHCSAF